MAQSSGSFLDEILKRRILQIIGVYVASFWLSMELGGWMIDELDAPANLTKYIFFGSFTLLPTVIMLAWFHGQPGRDQWTFRQGLFIATNLAVAFFVIQYFVKPVDDIVEDQQFVEAGIAPGDIEATEIVSVIDEEGNELTVEVAKENYHQPVLASFWQNKTDNEELDWLSYAGAWLVAKDLKRSPLLSVNTPYNSNSFRDQLQGRGYTNAVNEPLSLALQVAKKRATDWLLRGEFTQIGTVVQFTAYLYDVTSGEEVKQITASGDDWLNSLDQISEEIGDFLTADMTTDHNISTDLKIRDHATDSEEAIKLAIDGLNKVSFENDFTAAVESLNGALALDQNFADVHVGLMQLYRRMGDTASAIDSARKALVFDDKLYMEDAFAVKATIYALEGKNDLVLRALEQWVRLYPTSVEAHDTLANNYLVLGKIDEAQATFEKLYMLEPDLQDTLKSLGAIYRLQNNPDKALEVLNKYAQLYPDNEQAYESLAEAFIQFGRYDEAIDALEQAIFIGDNDLSAQIRMARVMASTDSIDRGLADLEALRGRATTDQQHYSILLTIEEVLLITGQMRRLLALYDDMEIYGSRVLPPIAQLFQLKGKKAAYLSYLNRSDEAIAIADEIVASTTPPFDQMSSFFYAGIYEINEDREKYQQVMTDMENFLQTYPMPVFDQFILSSSAKLKTWDGEYEQAVEIYDQAIAESSKSILTLQTLTVLSGMKAERGRVLVKAGRLDEAIAQMSELTDMSPLNGVAWKTLAEAHHIKGDSESAMISYNRMMTVWADADVEYLDKQKVPELKSLLGISENGQSGPAGD